MGKIIPYFQISENVIEISVGDTPYLYFKDLYDWSAPYKWIEYFVLGNKPG